MLTTEHVGDYPCLAQQSDGVIRYFSSSGLHYYDKYNLVSKVFNASDKWRHKKTKRGVILWRHYNSGPWSTQGDVDERILERELATEWALVTQPESQPESQPSGGINMSCKYCGAERDPLNGLRNECGTGITDIFIDVRSKQCHKNEVEQKKQADCRT